MAIFAISTIAPQESASAVQSRIVADDEFSFVVLPDTQAYVDGPDHPLFGRQTQWIADNKDNLNVAFVAHLGDIVESYPNRPKWQLASQYMSTLDQAAVPNSVLPGNHDLNLTTGDSALYDEFFPPARYSEASWNSPSASYGGYLGQSQFGPDPVDRRNKDNYALFSARGLDFILINIEYGAPDFALSWAQKVLNAFPGRRAIVATHSFVNTGGTRANSTTRQGSGVNTPNQMWTKFISTNCNIFMVVNGHWHDGEVSEARRRDLNSCGSPVDQILTDYQDRAHGGDGWLRYYTFKPATNSVEAVTYSPSLDRYDTSSLASFTFAYDMTARGPGTVDRSLVSPSSTWRWQYSNSPWSNNWSGTNFDDSAWAQGSAPLGFGNASIVTNIDVPAPVSNRPRSAQFRRTFTMADPTALSAVTVTTRADDGVAVHINGTEIGRSGLPAGPLSSTTYATAAPQTSAALANPTTFTVPASLLRAGLNVVSASMHVNFRATANVSFDLSISAKEAAQPAPTPPSAPTPGASQTGQTTTTLTWPHDPASGVVEYRVARNGSGVAVVAAPTHSFTDTGLTAQTTYSYSVVAVGPTGLSSLPGLISVTTAPAISVAKTLIQSGSAWRWQYVSSGWPAGWAAIEFDDSTWSTGSATFGFGSASVATNIDVPAPTSNRPRSAQFRKVLTIQNPSTLSDVRLTTRADDGVVIYINGTELGRSGLPSGGLTANTYATAAPRTAAAVSNQVTLSVPTSLLRPGTNVVTASTHLNYRGTADLTFDLSMTAIENLPGQEVHSAACEHDGWSG